MSRFLRRTGIGVLLVLAALFLGVPTAWADTAHEIPYEVHLDAGGISDWEMATLEVSGVYLDLYLYRGRPMYYGIVTLFNRGEQSLYVQGTSFTLMDAAGEAVMTTQALDAFPQVVAPGEKAFVASLSPLPLEATPWGLTFEADILVDYAAEGQRMLPVQNLALGENLSIRGAVVNDGEEEHFANIHALYFDEQGACIGHGLAVRRLEGYGAASFEVESATIERDDEYWKAGVNSYRVMAVAPAYQEVAPSGRSFLRAGRCLLPTKTESFMLHYTMGGEAGQVFVRTKLGDTLREISLLQVDCHTALCRVRNKGSKAPWWYHDPEPGYAYVLGLTLEREGKTFEVYLPGLDVSAYGQVLVGENADGYIYAQLQGEGQSPMKTDAYSFFDQPRRYRALREIPIRDATGEAYSRYREGDIVTAWGTCRNAEGVSSLVVMTQDGLRYIENQPDWLREG